MKHYGKVNYIDKNWFLVSIETQNDVKNLKQYFGLPENTIFEWLEGHQGEILIGAHRHTPIGIEHFALKRGHSVVEWVNSI